MTSTELREGNYLQREGHWLKIEVEHILHVRDGNMHNFQPIALNRDIVEKFGFVERSGRHVLQPEFLNIEYRLVDFHAWVFSIGFFNWNNEITNISYVHELQNLYFDIAREELQIKNL